MSWDIFSKSKIQYFLQKLKDKFVQKETGKGLSTNDYTTTDKNKVSKIDTTTTSASGNPISISGLKANQLAVNPIITLEPIQDLHGQSKPYPAGGGKNKFAYTVESIKAANTTGTWSNNVYTLNDITFTILTDSANNVIGINVNSSQGASADTNFQVAAAGSVVLTPSIEYKFNGHISPAGSASTWRMGLGIFGYVYGESDEKTASVNAEYSGNCFITVFSGAKPNNVKFYPMIRLATETDATFAPPSNISPISGYDKIEALSCGKNIWADGDISGTRLVQVNLTIPLEPGTYKISAIVTTQDTQYDYCLIFDPINNVSVGSMPHSTGSQRVSTTMHIANKCTQITFYAAASWASSADKTFSYKDIQIEKSNTVTDYTPYHKATSISKSLGQTVYWGRLNVRTGEFEVLGKIIRLNSLQWGYADGYFNVSIGLPADCVTVAILHGYKCFSSKYNAVQKGYLSMQSGELVLGDTGWSSVVRLIVKDSRFTDVTSFTNSLTNDDTLVYPLATPFTIQLTPHEISLLKDYAYVSTNGTNISLDYHNGELASLADVSQLGETVNELGEYIECNEFGSYVNISSYGANNKYTFPSDGYIFISGRSNTTGYIRVYTYGKTSNAINGGISINITGTQQMASLFVRRGMRCYVDTNITGTSIQFISLV